MADERISLSEAARRSGVSATTLKRWAAEKILPVRRGRWTAAAAAQARVVARMRERGYSLEDLKNAGREGRLAFGFTEELFSEEREGRISVAMIAEETGLEAELIERILVILGTPIGQQRNLTAEDAAALRHCARVLAAGLPLVAFLQLVRVYVQSMRRIADAEVRLFHLYVHEPLIRDAVPELEMAAEMGDLAADILPLAAPLTEYLHNRYLRFFVEQDVVGHMESGAADTAEIELGQVTITLCFIDLTGFTRYTEEEGDMEALDAVENFIASVESTLPREATIVKTIGDEVMVVSPDAASLTEWAVDFLGRFSRRPQPRVGIHCGEAVYRDGDYFGSQVNLAHRVVNRALAGEVLVTDRVAEAIEGRDRLGLEPIGSVSLKGFPAPTELFVVRAAG
jgi:adenylate cyclase